MALAKQIQRGRGQSPVGQGGFSKAAAGCKIDSGAGLIGQRGTGLAQRFRCSWSVCSRASSAHDKTWSCETFGPAESVPAFNFAKAVAVC